MAMTFGIAFICLQEGCIAAFPFETDLFRKKWNEVKCECKKRSSYTLTLNDIKWLKHIGKSKNPTAFSPHLVPGRTRPGSRVSFWLCLSWPCWYTCVPLHRIFCWPILTLVSMATALDSIGLLAVLWHWIFPHLAFLNREPTAHLWMMSHTLLESFKLI